MPGDRGFEGGLGSRRRERGQPAAGRLRGSRRRLHPSLRERPPPRRVSLIRQRGADLSGAFYKQPLQAASLPRDPVFEAWGPLDVDTVQEGAAVEVDDAEVIPRGGGGRQLQGVHLQRSARIQQDVGGTGGDGGRSQNPTQVGEGVAQTVAGVLLILVPPEGVHQDFPGEGAAGYSQKRQQGEFEPALTKGFILTGGAGKAHSTQSNESKTLLSQRVDHVDVSVSRPSKMLPVLEKASLLSLLLAFGPGQAPVTPTPRDHKLFRASLTATVVMDSPSDSVGFRVPIGRDRVASPSGNARLSGTGPGGWIEHVGVGGGGHALWRRGPRRRRGLPGSRPSPGSAPVLSRDCRRRRRPQSRRHQVGSGGRPMRIRPGLIALAALYGALAPRVARGQNPAWTANLIVQPFPSPFLADWKRNPTIAVLTVLYTGRNGQTFRVEAFARASGRGELGRVISPPFSFAFGPTTQLITAADILNWNTETSNQQYVTLAERSGRLPEGPIQLCARVLDQNSVQLTLTCTSVTIALPDPPRLIFPSNATTVSAVQPVFQWTPVIVPPEIGVTYRVRIVERHPQQTPKTALAANIPTFDQQIGGAPLLTYPLNGLPLESGKQYVWQISALDQTGLPIARNQGASEIWTFTLGGPSRPPGSFAGAFPDTLTVVPGVARLSGLSKATITETPFTYVLDGQATLTLLGPLSGTAQVSLSGLHVDKTSVSPAVFRGGSFTGALPTRVTRAGAGNSFIRFTSVAFDPQSGLTLGAALALPGVTAPFSGTVQLTAAGPAGRLSAQSTGGAPLATFGSDPAAFVVQEADVSLPGGNVTLSGSLRLMGQDIGCGAVSGTVDASGNLSATVACRPQQPIALVPGVSRFQLGVSALSGNIGADLSKGTSTYQLSAAGQLALDAGGAACGGSLSLTIANGGVTPGTLVPNCDASEASADLGWISVKLSNLRLQKLVYLPGSGFDFGLQVDLAPWIPTAPDLALPSAAGVTVDKNGFSVPAMDAAVARPPVTLGGFAIQVKHVSLPAFALTWQNWHAHSAAGFSFTLDGTASFAGLPQGEPTCLANAVVSFTGARLTGGQLTASLAGQNFTPSCDMPVGAGAVLQLQRVSGGIAVALAPQVAVITSPSVQGALVLPSFFDCSAGTDRHVALGAGLTLSPQGVLIGHVSGVSPPCPIDLAAVQINVTNAALDFSAGTGGAQGAVLSGSATGKFTAGATSVNGSGSVAIDLIQGRLTSGSLTFAGPFELDLPRSPAVLALRVPGATLDNAGLHVDGRGQLLLPNNQTIAATFDQVTVNPQTVVVSGGKMLFDAPFALEIGVGQGGGGALTWKALALGGALDVTSGIRVDLPTQLAIGANGLTASGTASGHLIYGGKDLDGLVVTFSSDFALGLSPAAVTQGSVSFAWHGAAVGSVDAQGFHPNLGALATDVIPARLGLPAANVAYLQLKDANGALLVSTQTVAGGVRIYTAPNVTVPLVFPALQLGRAAPPQVNVAFDITVDPLGSGITAGTVFAQIPAGAAGFDLSGAGLPFAVDSVRYTAGARSPSLAIYGAPVLFGSRQGSGVALQLDAMGMFSGAVDVTLPQNQSISLVSGFNGLTLSVSRVSGSFNAGLLNQSLIYDLSATGALAVGAYKAGATVEVSDQGTKVSQLTLPTGADTLAFVDLGALRVGLSDLQIPTFAYDGASGNWTFDLVFNAALQFPQLNSLTLPTVSGLELTPQGFTIPAINLPQLAVPPVTVAGFQVAPLAFRTARSVTYNWFTGQAPSDWGFGFDLQVGFAADAPPALQNLQLTVLNAGLTNGVFTGQIEPPTLSEPIAMSWGSIRQFGGALQAVTQTVNGVARQAQGVNVTVTGQYNYPALMRCAAAPQDTSAIVSVAINASGWLAGTANNVVPRCPVQVGPLSVQMTGSSLAFSVGSGAQGAELDGTASLKLAAPTTPDSVTASGALALDLVHGKVLGGSLTLTQPFRWSLPTAAPLLQFDVTAGRIDSSGFALSGSAALMLAPGDSVLGTLNGLLLSLPDLTVKRGSLTLTNGFAIAASLDPSAGLAWKTVSRTAAPPATGLLVAAPDTVVIDSSGFHLGGRAAASLAFNGKTYGPTQLAAQFDSGFAVGISPVAVRKGRVTFVSGTDTIAVVNANGFLPGNVFGVLPVPDSIPLPQFGIAYVRVRDAQHNLLITAQAAPGGGGAMQLATKPGTPVVLVIPALAGTGAAPTANVAFNVIYNTTTGTLASSNDSIAISSAPGATLFTLGALGLDVERLAFKMINGAGTFVADAKLRLPAAIGGADVRFKSLTLSPQGFSGTATAGAYTTTPPTNPQPFATATVSQSPSVAVQFNGATLTFGNGVSAKVSGQVVAPALAATPIFFTGQFTSGSGLSLGVDVNNLTPLSIGQASFAAQQVSVGAWDTAFTVTLGGILKMPQISQDFAVTFAGLTVGTHGVQFPSSLSVTGGPQTFNLFGMTLTAQDEQVGGQSCPGLGLAYASPKITLTVSGTLQFLGKTGTFCRLSDCLRRLGVDRRRVAAWLHGDRGQGADPRQPHPDHRGVFPRRLRSVLGHAPGSSRGGTLPRQRHHRQGWDDHRRGPDPRGDGEQRSLDPPVLVRGRQHRAARSRLGARLDAATQQLGAGGRGLLLPAGLLSHVVGEGDRPRQPRQQHLHRRDHGRLRRVGVSGDRQRSQRHHLRFEHDRPQDPRGVGPSSGAGSFDRRVRAEPERTTGAELQRGLGRDQLPELPDHVRGEGAVHPQRHHRGESFDRRCGVLGVRRVRVLDQGHLGDDSHGEHADRWRRLHRLGAEHPGRGDVVPALPRSGVGAVERLEWWRLRGPRGLQRPGPGPGLSPEG